MKKVPLLFILACSVRAALMLPGIEEARTARVVEANFLGRTIGGPPNTWISLFETDVHCLYYKTPNPANKEKGRIIWARGGCGSFRNLVVVEELPEVERFSFQYGVEDGHRTLRLGYVPEQNPEAPPLQTPKPHFP